MTGNLNLDIQVWSVIFPCTLFFYIYGHILWCYAWFIYMPLSDIISPI